MKSCDEVVRLLRQGGGVIARRDHPGLTGSLDWLLRTGRLAPVLPGVYASPTDVSDRLIRMRAAAARVPDGVLLTGAAARQTYWPEAPIEQIEVATRYDVRPAPGFRFIKRRIPPELVLEQQGLRMTTPALTAIELASLDDCDAIDHALRSRRVRLDDLYDALRLTPCRTGNLDRRKVLLDSRGEPWSGAERQAHRVLRAAGIHDWKANHKVRVNGLNYFIDIAFRRQRVAVEIDGRLHETEEDLFESDRWRQNALMLDGWLVFRFTWPMVRDHPEMMVATVRRALALKG